MRVALFSDIHGNITGLRAILAHLEAQGGADQLYTLGDIVGGGPGTDEVIELLLSRDVFMIRGNHEEMFLNLENYMQKIPSDWLSWAKRTAYWLRENLSDPYRKLLASLPVSQTVHMEERRLFVCHAGPTDTWMKICAPDVPLENLQAVFGEIDANAVAYGHYHHHHILWLDLKLLLNVASVGMRSDGLSAYTLLENVDGRWVVQQFQVPYDCAEEERLMIERRVPLP
jgi:predicted phosphodiesterase